MKTPTGGHYSSDTLNNRTAGGLLLAFLVAVIVVLSLATVPPIPISGTSTHEPMSDSQLDSNQSSSE